MHNILTSYPSTILHVTVSQTDDLPINGHLIIITRTNYIPGSDVTSAKSTLVDIDTYSEQNLLDIIGRNIQPGHLLQLCDVEVDESDLVDAAGFRDFYIMDTDEKLHPVLNPSFLIASPRLYETRRKTMCNLVLWRMQSEGILWDTLITDGDSYTTQDGHPVVYTDASSSRGKGSGAAAVSRDSITSFTVDTDDNNRAECVALFHALDSVDTGTVVASDSTNALMKALSHPRVQSMDIFIRKVKGHSGQEGNELADVYAKRARIEGVVGTFPNPSLP